MRTASTLLRGLVAAWLVSLAALPAAASARGESSVLRAMNSVRASHGLPALHVSHALARAASSHSAEMARSGVLSHGAFAQRLRHYVRAPMIGETLAWSTARCSGGMIVRMWMQSPPHRQILLTRGFRQAGVGVSRAADACFVTADFAGAR
jgi:uncharacterized protein YkwD